MVCRHEYGYGHWVSVHHQCRLLLHIAYNNGLLLVLVSRTAEWHAACWPILSAPQWQFIVLSHTCFTERFVGR